MVEHVFSFYKPNLYMLGINWALSLCMGMEFESLVMFRPLAHQYIQLTKKKKTFQALVDHLREQFR